MALTPEYVIVLTTLPAGAENDAFGRTLVEERLAACVNLLPPMESVYRWEGQVERDTERQVIIKTTRDRVAALWDRIRELHPYETPEFVVLTIADGSEAYLRWIGESTGNVKSQAPNPSLGFDRLSRAPASGPRSDRPTSSIPTEILTRLSVSPMA